MATHDFAFAAEPAIGFSCGLICSLFSDYSPYSIQFKVRKGRRLCDGRNGLPIFWNFRADTPRVYKSKQLRSDVHSRIILNQAVPEFIKGDSSAQTFILFSELGLICT